MGRHFPLPLPRSLPRCYEPPTPSHPIPPHRTPPHPTPHHTPIRPPNRIPTSPTPTSLTHTSTNLLACLQFFGTWCSSCRSLLPHIIKLAEQDPTVHWVLIDYGEQGRSAPVPPTSQSKDVPVVLPQTALLVGPSTSRAVPCWAATNIRLGSTWSPCLPASSACFPHGPCQPPGMPAYRR